MAQDKCRKAVVLGGYGLIGSACIRALQKDGCAVTGVGRSASLGPASNTEAAWITQDLGNPFSAELKNALVSADVVVNAAGALQTGLRDNLDAIHVTLVAQLIEAINGSQTRVVQISTAGVSDTASTDFMRSKSRGDNLLQQSSLDWVILRPTLVIGPQAYGGTALLRAAAAVPVIGPVILPDARIQTVFIGDVAGAVVLAGNGEIAAGTCADLTEMEERTLLETLTMLRRWQGFGEWITMVRFPGAVTAALAKGADLLGWLGWRSPLRTTALLTLQDGVTGDPANWEAAGGFRCRSFQETLLEIPATTQERWFARFYFVLPLLIAALSVFWIISGVMGLVSYEAAVAVLTSRGSGAGFASGAVVLGAAIDIALGAAVLVRACVRPACLGMIAVSLAYLAGATIWAPDLWLDPLGVLVKVIPAMMVPLTVLAVFEDR